LNNSNIIKVWNCVNSNCNRDRRNNINLFRGIAVVGDDQKLFSNSVENQSAKYWNITNRTHTNNIVPVLLPRGRGDQFANSFMTSSAQ
jgi:hypothetical protein